MTAPARRIDVLDTNVLLDDPNALGHFCGHDVVIPSSVIEEGDRILSTARALADAHGESDVVLIARDTNLRIKADALGVIAEDYRHARVDTDEHYSGVTERVIDRNRFDEVYRRGKLSFWDAEATEWDVFPQQFIILKAADNPGEMALTRYDAKNSILRLVDRHKEGVWGIFARNREQIFALDLLLDDNINLVTLDGMAGTGKTLMAIVCGLKLVAGDHRYRRLVVSRPIFLLGRDIGFLPGDLSEKLNPWMKPIFDNLELLLGVHDESIGRRKEGGPRYQALLDQGIIAVEPPTYIRGRSLPQQHLIVDEGQNLTPHEVKTVITRAGENTKVVLTGDPNQIDKPYVDAASNGLTYVVERFKKAPIAGHVSLRKGERSPLAELAATLL
jgi:PhoH-like ATPase